MEKFYWVKLCVWIDHKMRLISIQQPSQLPLSLRGSDKTYGAVVELGKRIHLVVWNGEKMFSYLMMRWYIEFSRSPMKYAWAKTASHFENKSFTHRTLKTRTYNFMANSRIMSLSNMQVLTEGMDFSGTFPLFVAIRCCLI